MELKFVTTNPVKLSMAKRILKGYGIKVVAHPLDLAEIQETDTVKVAISKARQALHTIRDSSFMVEDTGLNIEALNGFPGALLKPTMHTIGEKGLLLMVHGMNRKARFVNTAVFYDNNKGKFHTFTSYSYGRLAMSTSGRNIPGWAVGKIFIPDGWKKTIASMGKEELSRYMKDVEDGSHYSDIGQMLGDKIRKRSV